MIKQELKKIESRLDHNLSWILSLIEKIPIHLIDERLSKITINSNNILEICFYSVENKCHAFKIYIGLKNSFDETYFQLNLISSNEEILIDEIDKYINPNENDYLLFKHFIEAILKSTFKEVEYFFEGDSTKILKKVISYEIQYPDGGKIEFEHLLKKHSFKWPWQKAVRRTLRTFEPWLT